MLLKKNNTWLTISIFVVIVFFIGMYNSINISPILNSDYQFKFTNYLFYTFLVNLIIYTIKIILLISIFKLSFLVFDIKLKISLTSLIIIAFMLKYLLVYILKLITFYSLNGEMEIEYYKKFESSFDFSNLLNFNSENFEYLINFISIFDIIFIVIVTLIFDNYHKLGFLKSSKVIVLPFLIYVLLIAIFKTTFF